ncbi:MAG: type IV secretory system conjugative DNA transfer family protein [Thermoplasmataceae archaeon]
MFDYEVSPGKQDDLKMVNNIVKLGFSGLSEVMVPLEHLINHNLIVGRTGTGKSNLLASMWKIYSDIEGSNVIVFDPHGQLSDRIIAENGSMDVVYISTQEKYSINGRRIGFNVLSTNGKSADEIGIVTDTVKELFSGESMFSKGTWGPRLELIFTTVLRFMLTANPDANLSDFLSMISDREILKSMDGKIPEDIWKAMKTVISERNRWNEFIASTINKLVPVLSRPELRKLVSSQADSVDISSLLMEGNKLVIVEVSKTQMSGDMTSLIGTLILFKIWNSSLRSGSKRKTFMLLDEAQNFPAKIIAEILSEGRKYGVFLTLSSQYLDQYDRHNLSSIIGNSGAFFAFRCSESDARMLSSSLRPESLRDNTMKSILSSPRNYVTMWNNFSGITEPPLSFKPVLWTGSGNGDVEEIKRRSVIKYGSDEISSQMGVTPKLSSPHDFITELFSNYLKGRSLDLNKEIIINGFRADGLFNYNGHTIIVESEVSDITKPQRIRDKLLHFPNNKIIFLCGKDMGQKIYEQILQRQLTLDVKEEKRNVNDLLNMQYVGLQRIFILETRGNIFYMVQRGRLKRFKIEMLDIDGSYILTGDIKTVAMKELALSLLRRQNKYCLPKEQIKSMGMFNDEFLNSISGNNQFVFETAIYF